MTKMTYVQAIDYVLGLVDNDEVAEKLEALKVQLGKRAIRKPTKTQRENEDVKVAILDILTDEGQRCKDIAEPLGITGQKCAALLRQLVDAGLADKYVEKRTTYFIKVVA